jgi:hypothetical protein
MVSLLKHACGLNGSFEQVQDLVENDADVNGVDRTHTTALHVAAMFGSVRIVELLVRHGAEVDRRNNLGNTPLMQCIHYMSTLDRNQLQNVDHFEVVNALINARADVNSRNTLLCSPLHEAAMSGSRRVAVLLVEHGAQVFARNRHNRLPVDEVSVGTAQNPGNHIDVADYLNGEMERIDRAQREQFCRDDFLPFAMGLHPRLGNDSNVLELSIDTLRGIWNALRRKHNLPIEE